jgi:glycosyltransferase involved in cell wall biosynthesis
MGSPQGNALTSVLIVAMRGGPGGCGIRCLMRAQSMSIHSLDRKPRILVANPSRQHSHHAALALLEAGFLGCYATGVPVYYGELGAPWRALVRRFSTYEEVAPLRELTRVNMVGPAFNRLFARYLPGFITEPIHYQTYRMFDRWVARLIARDHFDAVILYENSALYSFQAAKKIGAKCILDAASLHRVEADRRLGRVGPPKGYKARVDLRKDREVMLADCIFATSELAAETYRTNIGSEKCLKTIPLGVDTDRFKPGMEQKLSHMALQPFTFIFVGSATVRKGFDFILESMERLLSEGLSFRLSVAGVIDRSLLTGREQVLNNIRECGMISHNELPSVLRGAQCLLLPSRVDGFGMVVPEAMACGVPAIVSDMVGAKEVIEEGHNGFIVPSGNPDALVDRMRWCICNATSVHRMSTAARAAAERYSWANYRRRLSAAVREVLSARSEPRDEVDRIGRIT